MMDLLHIRSDMSESFTDTSKDIWSKKILKEKGPKLYAKWKVYDSMYNSWDDKK